MKRKRHNPEQIIRKLRTAEQLFNKGQSVADVCRALEVSAPTCNRINPFKHFWRFAQD